MQVALFTYADTISHATDYLGAARDAETERKARRAVQSAANAFCAVRNWAIFYKRGRFFTSRPYSTGLITYVAATRTVTLSGGTWPAWAGDGTIQVGVGGNLVLVQYPVSSVLSSTALQLQMATALNVDITTPTPYTLVQEAYPLPVDFGRMSQLVNMSQARELSYQTFGEFERQMRLNVAPSQPWIYTYAGDPRRYGTLSIYLYPAPDDTYTLDYTYQRASRALNMHGATPVVAYSDGKATISNSSTTVTGTGTLWTPDMVNAAIRFAALPSSQIPTGQSGTSPFALQRTIVGFTNQNTLMIDAVPGVDLSGVPYAISDPVDLEMGAMMNYFLREVEKQCRIILRSKPEQYEEQEYQRALTLAMEADRRHYEEQSTFAGGLGRVRVASLASGPTVGG